jgi:inositol-pentakisphosphate 2-kinase
MDHTSTLNPGTPPPPGFLLSDSADWEYFAEGAANILFRYVGTHPYFNPFLLRLRKLLPGAPTTKQLHEHLNTRFAPLLGNYMLRCDLIELDSELIPTFNKILQDEEAAEYDWAGRPVTPKGRARRLLDAEERWGMLVEDMSCGNYLYHNDEDEPEAEDPGEEWRDMATVEFKPKWLTQSPNAPSNWTLCRTCAVRLMKGHRRRGDEEVPEYCPLDLTSGEKARVEQAVFAIVNTQNSVMIADPTPGSDEEDESMEDAGEDQDQPVGAEQVSHELAKNLEMSLVTLLTLFFQQSTVIPLLAELQDRFGMRGVFTSATLALMGDKEQLPSEQEFERALVQAREKEGEDNDIWTAMTLRDCSLFLKVWVRRRMGKRMEARIECKAGDLDLKTGEGGRAVYWRDVERRLRKGGWYIKKDVGRNCRTGEGMA